MSTQSQSQPWSRVRTASVAILSAIVIAFLAAPVASARQQESAPPTVSSAEVADDELKKFAKNMLDVLAIQQRVQQELASVQDPEVATQLQQQANQEMVAVVTGRDMDVERYNSISHSLGVDAELKRRFDEVKEEVEKATE